MMEERKQADQEERVTRQKKQNLVMEGLKEQTITHSITKQIKTETNQLIGDIMHGSRSNDPKRLKPSRADIKAMNNIFYKQRALAETRAIEHMPKNQQKDPLPELPLDHILFGNPAFIK